MEAVATQQTAFFSRLLRRVSAPAISTWLLAGGLVLYLGMDGGGYDIVVHSQVGIVVWWVVLVGAAWGVLPAGRMTRTALGALGLFGGFVIWTAIGAGWSESSELALQNLALVACYLGVLLLALGVHRDRDVAVRHTVSAVATAGVIIAGFALLSRLRPDLFAAAHQTTAFLPGAKGRIAWPLNYWNALAAMIAMVLPLLFANATTARTLLGQAAAAGSIPMVSLCAYLTFSRGGALAAGGALIVFILLAENRIPKLATAAVAGGGSVILIAGAVHRNAVENGLHNAAARHQGAGLLVAVLLVCGGVAMAQAGIGLACRHAALPRLLRIPINRARVLLAVAVVAGVTIGLAAHGPTRLSHVWRDFKRPAPAVLHHNDLSRFGSTSGNGRYAYWKASAKLADQHLLRGWGPGSFQLLWPPHATFYSPVLNAHSLYVETLLENGVIGLALLAVFMAVLIGGAIALAVRSPYELRTRAAAAAAAGVAFAISATFEWIWQIPALPVAFILVCGTCLAPRRIGPSPIGGDRTGQRSQTGEAAKVSRAASIRRVGGLALVRLGLPAVAVVALIAISVPLATVTAVRRSQGAAAAGNTTLALTDARAGARVEPDAASPQIQLALVQELRQDYADALAAATRATADEPLSWRAWLVRSRIAAEDGRAAAALSAYRQAKSLNPTSFLFKS